MAQTTRWVTTDEDEPPQIPMTAASKENGKTIVDDQCPELSKQRETGFGLQKILLGSNGTVTQGKPKNTQRKLELNGEDVKNPFRRKGRDKDRGKNGYPPQTRNKALEKSRLRISSSRNRSMRRMKHHRDKEDGRLLDIELLSEENLGTVKIQEEGRTLNQGMLTDNVLLSHELVKGYGTKGISPRCMFKIDMQKAHDSLEWHFLEEIPWSTFEVKETVSRAMPTINRQVNGQKWTVKFLSYAGRLKLVNSVLTSMKDFWTQIFLLPKQVLKRVETMCKRFLWNGQRRHSLHGTHSVGQK
ncbi:hypothetical protein MTR67_048113 [Solanum verrucosum]|uniref:Reverse transcriptase domain-containing protein n=1 Tax=Solanum verrucosum TaxID=315347 RepID=A0AAF0UXD3_SOLVR|nr:hypothetical protein MTR67_048113 [Solanum verrucosum]